VRLLKEEKCLEADRPARPAVIHSLQLRVDGLASARCPRRRSRAPRRVAAAPDAVFIVKMISRQLISRHMRNACAVSGNAAGQQDAADRGSHTAAGIMPRGYVGL
jgi:hypothetical protein